jgi:hypothetical protein
MNVILISSIVRYLSYLREDLLLLITLTAATVVILLSDTILVSRHSAYAQDSGIRTNPISPTDGNTSQQQIPEGQQLIVIPSLSPDNINTSIEQPEAIVEDTEQGQGLGQELTTQQETTIDVIEESREQVTDELRNSQIQREMMQQQEQEEKEVEILEQQEDREQEMQEGLDEVTKTTTSKLIEEEEEEEQNNEQDDNDMEEERQDNSNDANDDIPLELPFP